MKEEAPVEFYDIEQEYGFLNNIYPAGFTVGDVQYQTNEHYFQSKKFEGHPYEWQVAAAETADLAFDMGQNRDYPLRADWSEAKETIMYTGLRYKFQQNEELRKKLLETGNRPIVEHTEHDSYWGDGGDGSGQNRLGHLLQRLRD